MCADASSAERQAQHAAARLRTKHYCDIATLAWEAQLEGLVREACPLALAMDWSAEVDPEVVRWQAEVHPSPPPLANAVNSGKLTTGHWVHTEGLAVSIAVTMHGVGPME